MTVSEKLRLVQGLHSHAEMFGFKWDDDSDWTWHDVACKIADEVDAENAKLREEFNKMDVWHSKELTAAMDENAKLRELCADLLKGFDCGWLSDVCGDCERDGMGMPIGGCKLENRARELGIEVEP